MGQQTTALPLDAAEAPADGLAIAQVALLVAARGREEGGRLLVARRSEGRRLAREMPHGALLDDVEEQVASITTDRSVTGSL